MLDLSGNARWLYDTRGRVTQETRVISDTGGGTFVTQWSYDAADRVVWQKYPGGANGEIGEQVNTSYTAQGLVKSVSGANVYVGDTLYNVRGQVYERRLGSTLGVVKQLYSYAATENFRLTALKSGVSPSYNTLQNVTYSYDDAGNVLTIADSAAYGGSQTQKFTYDYLDRLSTACTLNGANCATSDGSYGVYSQRSYQYNNAGNPSPGSGQALTSFEGAAFAYNDAAHKHAVTHVGGVQRYWYDQDGNATRRIAPWGTDITLAYDAENRLTQVSNGVTASYVYDGDGNRVKAVVNSTTSIYVGAYYEVTGGVVKKYYYAGGMRVAENNGGVLHFLLTDHLGSTAVTTSDTGVRVTELRYYPYGDSARYNPGGQITTYRFTGQRWDPGTGLYFYGARWYDPLIGRFIQADTIVPSPGDPQSLNRYSYVLNNPLKYNDPSGHIANWVIGGLVGGLVGGGLYALNEWRQGDLDLHLNVSIQGGLKIDAGGDWGDLGAAMGTGAAAGLLMATPGGQAAGVGMAANLVADHLGNLAEWKDFNAGRHALTCAVGAAEGLVGAKVGKAMVKAGETLFYDQVMAQVGNGLVFGAVDEATQVAAGGGGDINSIVSSGIGNALGSGYAFGMSKGIDFMLGKGGPEWLRKLLYLQAETTSDVIQASVNASQQSPN